MSKIALITGANGGLGTAMCQKLAQEGFVVLANGLSEEKLVQWQSNQKSEGFDFRIYPADVGSFEACEAMVAKITSEVGVIDVLVNNAGITKDGVFKKMSKEQWSAVMRTNLDSIFNVTRQVINPMIEQNYGRIINISSVNGEKGQFGQTNYATAKAGMHGFTMSLAQETASCGITVNTISPGYIGTDMVLSIDEKIRQNIISTIPIKRLGKPTEIADIVAFLAKEESGFITGANISANGGLNMHY